MSCVRQVYGKRAFEGGGLAPVATHPEFEPYAGSPRRHPPPPAYRFLTGLMRRGTRRPSFHLRWLCLPLLGFVHAVAVAQEVQRQIEQDVWIPLLTASNAFDAEGFLAVQSRDLVRIATDANDIHGFSRYESEIRAGFARARSRGVRRTSEVRFLTRTASGDLAHETGYFRSRATLPDGSVRVAYTRFEFVMRREDGRWRILLDKDTADDGRITERDFLSATAMGHTVTEP